jgi:hypothetical protein
MRSVTKPVNGAITLTTAIEELLSQALRIPTPENCQPWSFVIDGTCVEVFHDSARIRFGDMPYDMSPVNLGMVAETLEILASAAGLQPQMTFFLDHQTDERPWLTVAFREAETMPDPLAAAFASRYSDRRRFAGGSLTDAVYREVVNEAQKFAGVHLYLTNQYNAELIDLFRRADFVFAKYEPIWRDLSRWMRYWDKEIAATQDGMSWRSVLYEDERWYHYFQSRLWWLMGLYKSSPAWLEAIERRLFGASGEFTPLDFSNGAGIGCVTVPSTSRLDLVAGGRLVLRAWLLINARGYSFQALTNVTTLVYPTSVGNYTLPSPYRELMADGYDQLQAAFGFADHEIPIFCFRTGLPIGPRAANTQSLRRLDRIQHKMECGLG